MDTMSWLAYWTCLGLLLLLKAYNINRLWPSSAMVLTLWLQNSHLRGGEYVLAKVAAFAHTVSTYKREKTDKTEEVNQELVVKGSDGGGGSDGTEDMGSRIGIGGDSDVNSNPLKEKEEKKQKKVSRPKMYSSTPDGRKSGVTLSGLKGRCSGDESSNSDSTVDPDKVKVDEETETEAAAEAESNAETEAAVETKIDPANPKETEPETSGTT
jgi:hypothetical protein